MRHKILRRSGLLVGVPTAAAIVLTASSAFAVTYNVGPTRSSRSPCALLSDSSITLRPGDVIQVDPGTYREACRIEQSGTADAPITIRGVGGRPVIDGTGLELDGDAGRPRALFQFSSPDGRVGANNWVVENMEFTNGRNSLDNASAIRVTERSTNVALRDIVVHDSQNGITSDTGASLSIENSEIYANGTGSSSPRAGHNVFLAGLTSRIVGNVIRDSNGGQNVRVHMNHSFIAYNHILRGGAYDIDIEHNYKNESPVSRIILLSNVIQRSPTATNPSESIVFGIDSSAAGTPNTAVYMYSNTVLLAASTNRLLNGIGPSRGTIRMYFYNNLVNSPVAGGGISLNPATDPLIEGSTNFARMGVFVPSTLTRTVVAADPLFTSATDLTPRMGAPPVDQGSTPPMFPDVTGAMVSGVPASSPRQPFPTVGVAARTVMNALDIGAYEGLSGTGCRSNADCASTPSTPICDTASGMCRACSPVGAGSASCASTPSTPFCSGTGATAGQCVTSPPAITSPTMGSTTPTNTPTIRGTGPASSTVQVIIDGTPAGTAMTDPSGNFSFTPTSPLSPGMHTVTAANVGPGTTVGPTGTPVSFSVPSGGCTTNAECSGATPICDTTTRMCRACGVATQATDCPNPPATACNATTGACVTPAAAITTPMAGGRTGSTPTISGTATPGQRVTVNVDGMPVGTVTADPSGNWTLPWPTGRTPLTSGPHTATASVPNGAGTTTSTPVTFTVGCSTNLDCPASTPFCNTATGVCRGCSPPGAGSPDCGGAVPYCSSTGETAGRCVATPPTITSPMNGSTTPSDRPVIRGTGPASSTVEVFIDGADVGPAMTDASGNFEFTPPMSLSPGMHTVAAANVGPGTTVGPRGTPVGFTVGMPVGCTTNAECSGATPICDTAMRVCRGCAPAGAGSPDCTATPSTPYCSSTGATSGRCVATPPSITSPMNGGTTGDRPVVRGTGTPSSTVEVYIDGMRVGTAPTDAAGNFEFTPTMPLTPGMHNVTAANVGPGTTVGPTGMPVGFTVSMGTMCTSNTDCSGRTPICDGTTRTCRACSPTSATDCAAPRPTCSTTGDTAGMCIATVPTITSPTEGGSTPSQRPEIRGVGTPGTTVVIIIDGREVGRATVDMDGNFRYTPTMDLPRGPHTVAGAPVTGDPDGGVDGGVVGTPGPTVRFNVAPCTSDLDCSGATPVCDTTRGICIARGDGGTDAGDSGADASDGDVDSGLPYDGGPTPNLSLTGNGCGCSTVGGDSANDAGLALGMGLVGLALARRNRRRRAD